MAAWLAYLKSRLLLPDLSSDGEPSGEEMAAALAFQLKRLESMQEAGARIMARGRLGQDFFARGAPEKFSISQTTVFDVTLFDLLKCYSEQSRRQAGTTLHIEAWDIYSVDDALERLHALVGKIPDWQTMSGFLPKGLKEGLGLRSAVASTFAASLEMAREGKLRLRQNDTFGQIYIRSSADDLENRPVPEIESVQQDDSR